MNCPNCGAPMRQEPGQGYLVCDSCRSIRHPEPDLDGIVTGGASTDRNCPVCREPLSEAALLGQPILHCPKCLGSLIPAETFVFLVAHLRLKKDGTPYPPRCIEPAELERVLHCPKCGGRMDTHPYAGPGNIVIDNCPGCSVNWVDAQELRRVAAAADGSPNPDAWKSL